MLNQYKRNDVSQFLTQKVNKQFSWRSGSKPDTTGILIWSEVFTYDSKNGEQIAIILLDTQGSFDNESSVRDCSTIFALSALLSSVLCYNVMQNIREDNLQYLHLFTEYGKLLLKECSEKPFQNLLFIVRDWSYPFESDYGWNGGQQVVNKRLEKIIKQTEDMQMLRDDIRSNFEAIQGFLMPYPGEVVAQDQHFDGKLIDISPKFISALKDLVPKLFAPENLIVKKLYGQKIRAKDWIQCFESYMRIFNGSEMPEPKSIYEVNKIPNLIFYHFLYFFDVFMILL